MKTSKRIFALLAVAVMLLSFAPAAMFAAAGDITELKVAGKDITADLVDATSLTNVAQLGAVADYTVNVPLTPAQQAADASSLVEVTDTGADFKVAFYEGGTGEGTTILAVTDTDADALATVLPTNTHFEPGDVLWISDGVAQVIRVLFVTPSTGTIEGEGTPEEVAFNVVVPLAVDFALDPGELNIEGNQIFGGDYVVYNETPNYAVNVEFSVQDEASAGIAILAPSMAFSGSDKQAKMNIVNASSLTVASGAVTAVSYDSAATGAEAKRLDLARRTVALSAADANDQGTAVKTTLALAPYSGTLAAANASAFTFRGNLNPNATDAYASGDVAVTATYTLTGVGVPKYTKEAPIRVGAGAKAFAVEGYGFVDTANTSGEQNSMWLNPDNGNGYAGHTTLTYTAAEAEAETVFIGMALPAGTTVTGIYFGEVGAPTSEFSNQTATFDLTGTADDERIELLPGWSEAAVGRTFEFYIVLSNDEVWAVTVNANA
jgi:hypothetical protein